MDLNRLRTVLSIGSRTFGVLLLAGFLLAACGDDDDDDDNGAGGDVETTATVDATVPESDATEAETTATEADADATSDEDTASPTGDATEDEADTTETGDDMTPTEDDTAATEADDGTATESDSTAGTPTEDDGTTTPDATDGTATESDDGTATESDDTTATESDDATGTGTEDDATGDTGELGSEIEGDGFTIVVEGVEPFVGVPGMLEPDEGEQFVAITVTIENTGSDDPLPLLRTLSSMHLETGDGERYDVDLLASAVLLLNDQGIMDTQIDPGSEVTGSVGFQVPTDAEELMLVIEVSDTGETVEIDLSDEM